MVKVMVRQLKHVVTDKKNTGVNYKSVMRCEPSPA